MSMTCRTFLPPGCNVDKALWCATTTSLRIQRCAPVPPATKRARSYPPPRLLICPQDPQGERICSPVLTHAPGGTILQMFPRAWWCTRGNICSPVLGRAPGGTFLRICIRMCSPVLGHAPRIPRVSALVPPCLLTAREHF